MAATLLCPPFYMWIFLTIVFKFQVHKPYETKYASIGTHCADQRCYVAGFQFETILLAVPFTQPAVTLNLTRVCGFHPSRRALSKWTKHGQTALVIPGHDPPVDITVFMDVALNPGPPWQISHLKVSGKLEYPNLHVSDSSTTTYTRNQLLHYRHCQKSWIAPLQLQALKVNGIFKYRGRRGGKHRIPVKISQRQDFENENNYAQFLSYSPKQQYVNLNNLTLVPRNPPVSKCSSNAFEFCLLNARSIRNKTVIIKDFVVDNNIDILAITESWLRPTGDEIFIGNLCPTGYRFIHVPRIDSVGGGVGLLFKESLHIKPKTEHQFKSFEYMNISLVNLQNVRVIILYRPPPSQSNLLTPGLFFEEFSLFLEQIVSSPGNLLLVGDFNFHVDDIHDTCAQRFLSLLESFNLKQYVSEPTHSSGHILDLVIARSEENIIENVNVFDPVISDHSAIQLQLTLKKPQFMKRATTFRKLRSLNCDTLKTDVSSSSLIRDYDNMDVHTLVNQYDKILREIMDSLAPVKRRIVTLRPKAPWYTSEIDEQKRIRRKLERKWRSSRFQSDRNNYTNQCNLVNNLIHTSKSAHYTQIIKDGASDQKTLFKTVSRLLHKNAPTCFPSSPDTSTLANSFADFFTDKVEKIQIKIAVNNRGQVEPLPCTPDFCSSEFSNFCSINSENISVMIRRAANKSCDLDPLPAVVLQDCIHILLPVITKIINLSLETGTMPDPLKIALLTPLLKKPNANHEEFGNFRPISNLSFISKSIEKAVAQQLTKYISDNALDESFQSAYKSFHSTETALLRVQNDILLSLDENKSVILVLLDLSAAFDTVDHSILISRLSERFGLKGNVLNWFKSYLSFRKQFVRIDGCDSTMHELTRGVPQGSVLGPFLYSLYTAPLGDLARQHNLHYHFFADDSQLYISFKTKSQDELISSKSRIEKCIDDINSWMVVNKLKLNEDKTELLLIHSKFQPSPPLDYIQIGDERIMPSSSARNLGVMFHEHFNYNEHVNKVCKSSYYHIRNISTIRKYLNKDCMEIIIHAFISSRLDYCNSLLYGIPKYLLQKLQHVQNTAARTLTLTKKFSHITPVLITLHWLPVTYRIQYKILLLVYKALNGSAPKYVSELLKHVSSRQHNLRSNSKELLFQPRSKLKTYGDRCFSVSAPKLWNILPLKIKKSPSVDIFKKSLKTYLFNLFLNDSDFR